MTSVFVGQGLQFSKDRGFEMKKLLVLLIVLFVFGCANVAPKDAELRHESSEQALLTEAEFMDRVSQSATMIYEGMRAIIDSVQLYTVDNDGNLPTGSPLEVKALLLDGGYLHEWPAVPPFAFTDPDSLEFKYALGYDDMDGLGEMDDVIFLQDLKVEVCEEFFRLYPGDMPGDVIFDYEANGNKYPGDVFGRHVKVYAITWSTTDPIEYCDIEWVMQYNVPASPKPGRK